MVYDVNAGLRLPNLRDDYQAGLEARAWRQEQEAANALRGAMQQYGAAAMRGDQNALGILAQYDPDYALGLMGSQQDMELARRQDTRAGESHGMSMKINQQQLEQARVAGQREAAKYAAGLAEAERAAELAEIDRVGTALSLAYQGGKEEWDRVAPSILENAPDELKGLTFDTAPYGMALLGGAVEGFKAPEVKPHNVPAGGTVIDANNPAAGPIFTAPAKPVVPQVGAPQPGYVYEYDELGRPVSAKPVPGTAAAREAEKADREAAAEAAAAERNAGQRDVTTDIITNTAAKAREEANRFGTTGNLGALTRRIMPGGAANANDLQRQTDALKAVATVEQLMAMKQNSPTGASGMGAMTDKEAEMLAARIGALDPNSRDYLRDLDDAERELYRFVHGPEEGDRIFLETRGLVPGAGGEGAVVPGGTSGRTRSGISWGVQ